MAYISHAQMHSISRVDICISARFKVNCEVMPLRSFEEGKLRGALADGLRKSVTAYGFVSIFLLQV